ncbi:MAG: SDR family oxidoreductase [Epsilonproteobacteria bacterium]|nr:SDR family oxidoreductase [Campylobacterota bacterium]
MIILTGASSGIGKAIKEELKNEKIVTICRNCEIKADFANLKEVKNIKLKNVKGIINCAGVGYFGAFEDINTDKLIDMININLTAPMILTKNHLKDIKKNKGFVINIASTSALTPARLGVAYSSTKAALIQFSKSLFEEVRKSGVKVCSIIPDMTLTNFHNNTFFKPSSEDLAHIKPSDIAQIVKQVINTPANMVIEEIVIKPQIFKIEKKPLN